MIFENITPLKLTLWAWLIFSFVGLVLNIIKFDLLALLLYVQIIFALILLINWETRL